MGYTTYQLVEAAAWHGQAVVGGLGGLLLVVETRPLCGSQFFFADYEKRILEAVENELKLKRA